MKKRVKWEYSGLIILLFLVGFMFYFASDLELTGYVSINTSSFSSSSDFSNGTFSNTFSLGNGDHIRLGFNLTRVSSLTAAGYLNGAEGIFVIGDYAYVTANLNNSINIINITDKSNPIRISSLVDSGSGVSGYLNGARRVYILGNHAYVTAFNNDSFNIINITNKSNPIRISSLVDSGYLNAAEGVYVSGNYSYVASEGNDSINIINITDKLNPVNLSHLVDSGYLNGAQGIFVVGDYAYVTAGLNDSINIINITDKSNPTRISSLVDSGYLNGAIGVYVVGDYVYVTAFSNHSINIINITDKSNPTRISSLVDSGSGTSGYLNAVSGIFVVGDYAYVTGKSNDSMSIIDISNKSNPTRISSLVDGIGDAGFSGYLNGADGIYVLGDYAYVTANSNDSTSVFNINQSYPSGTYESEVINATYTAKWINISWNGTEPTDTNLSLAYRSCDDSACSGETYSSYLDSSPVTLDINNNQYFQFKANFTTTNTSFSPSLHSVDIFYSDDITAPTATFTCSPSSVNIGDTVTCTCTGTDSETGVQSVSSPLTFQGIDAGDFTISGCTVTDLVGNSASATGSYTVLGSGGGTTSGSGGGTPTLQKTHLLIQVNPGEPTTITSFEGTGVKEIIIEVNKEVSNVRIKVLKYDSKPATVSVENPGKTYRYLEINTENLNNNLEKGIVKFEVEKSWVSDNGLDKNDLTTFKFENSTEKWNSLQTSFDSEDDNFYIYKVELDSFSFFAIGEKPTVIEQITSIINESYEQASETKTGLILWWIFVAILVIGIIAIGFFIVREIRRIRKTEGGIGTLPNVYSF